MIAALFGLGILTAILVPLLVATFPTWEWRLLCWLNRRRIVRASRDYRAAIRRPR
jgi:hypothetical protein